MNWTPEQRLKLIKALATQSVDAPVGESHQQLMRRIIVLCEYPSPFLEKNKGSYKDVLWAVNNE